ncbi:MAG: hypothetical protein PVI90_04530 [Desulfobacteraceae bacterium]|jgi:hypothetical protein
MSFKLTKFYYFPLLISFFVISSSPAFSDDGVSSIKVTPDIRAYAISTVKPVLDSYAKKDKLSVLLKASKVLIDPEKGIHVNAIKPSNYIIYDILDKIKFGFLITFKLSPEQKKNIKFWHSKYMQKNPADVFFAPSADDIIKTRAAFGCSHYARSFMAVAKALNLIDNPKDLRYVVSSKADDYDRALEKNDKEMTINGHQFVIAKIDSRWIAINTSKSEWTAMPKGFSPDALNPPENVPIWFESYPEFIFLLRKIGKDYDDDCDDNSLNALMNISRSGNAQDSNFKWNKFAAMQ